MIKNYLTKASWALSLSALAGLYGEPQEYQPIQDLTKIEILTPSIAIQRTEKLRLHNGLEALLISDPEANLSGAMMSVNAGSWQDPVNHPGLAHYLEHMLFLGTLRYPHESEYDRFITQHGGQSNAFTANDTTNYLFTVNPGAFKEALSRFSSFFKEPLFNASGVSRELQAIDQEFAKNLENDTIRQLYVLKELAHPEHPFHAFNMGNSASLAQTSREILEEWYQKTYSANLMRLVVYSSLPLEELRPAVIRDFGGIPGKDLQKPLVRQKAYTKDLEGKFIFIEPVKDTRTLTIAWELSPKFARMKDTKPEELVCTVLGHEGEKSLLAQLKHEKLAESLSCGGTKLGNDMMLLYLQVELTDEGLKDVDQVITRTFQAIANLKEKGVPGYLFDEVKRMATIEYQYQAKENEFWMLMKHAYQVQDEEMGTYPEKTLVIHKYAPEAVKELISELTPENAIFLIMAPSKLTRVSSEKTEKWLGVRYTIKPIGKEIFSKWQHATPQAEIALPAPNPFIPQNLHLVAKANPAGTTLIPKPQVVLNDARGTIYYAVDDRFGVPKISWHIHVLTPEISMEDPTKIVLGDLYVKALKDALNRFSYPADIAGLQYELKREKNGIEIIIDGYSDNADKLLNEILKTMAALPVSMENFKVLKDSLFRGYQNFSLERPLDQSLEIFKTVLYEDFVTEKEKAAAIRKITFKRFQDFAQNIWNETYIEGILFGNLTEKQARSVTDRIHLTFNKGVYPEEDHLKDAVIILPNDEGPFYLESHTRALGNAALLAVENPSFSFKERAAQEILMQGIREPFFSTLRTKQQTGYIVHSFPEEVERKLFNLFTVQSNTHDVRDLLARFEAFIEGYLQELGKGELSEEQFEAIRKAQVLKLLEPAKNTKAMGELLNTLAFDYDGAFDWIENRIKATETLTYNEFLEFAKRFLGRQNKRRLAILLKGEIPEENEFSYIRARTWNAIRKASQYQTR